MLIWDFIRDFLVQNIFGGFDSQGDLYNVTIGVFNGDDGFSGNVTTCDTFLPINVFDEGNGVVQKYICLGDWLSTTTTIIIMCLIVVLFAMLVRWVFKTVVSAFLLR